MSSTEESSFETYSKIVRDNGIKDEIKDVIVKAPELAGDQFASICKLVTVVFKDENIPSLHLFVKQPVTNPEYATQIRELMMFEKEARFFNLLLPELKKFAEKSSGYDGFLDRILPKCYFASDNLVVFENLVLKGYSILDKKAPHDFETARQVIKNVAQIQGTILAYMEHIGREEFEKQNAFITARSARAEEGTRLNGPWVDVPINEKPIPGSDKALEHFLKYENCGFAESIKLYKRGNQKCPDVVNHGDLWNGNVMFQRNAQTQKPENSLIVDIQTIILGTPALDIQHYLFVTADHHMVHTSWKKLLAIYYKDLTEIVETLGQKVFFTLEDLEIDFKVKCLAGSFMALYSAYAFYALDYVGDLANAEGDGTEVYRAQMNASIAKLIGPMGELFSTKIVKLFHLYRDVQAGIELQE